MCKLLVLVGIGGACTDIGGHARTSNGPKVGFFLPESILFLDIMNI